MDPPHEMEASTFIGQVKADMEDNDSILPPLIPEDQITPLELTPASNPGLKYHPKDNVANSTTHKTTRSVGKSKAMPEPIFPPGTHKVIHSTLSTLPKLNDFEELQEAWESDLVIIDPSESANLPKNLSDNDDSTTTCSPEAPHLQARIRTLTAAINARTALCRDASTKMITLVQENKHLYYQAEARFFAYVLVPCLKLPGLVQRHAPEGIRALRECQEQVKHGFAVMTGNVTPEVQEENRRLKDRIVEQDTLLWESSLHRYRLIREREMLRRQIALLERGQGYGVGTDDLTEEEQTAFEPDTPEDVEKRRAAEKEKEKETEESNEKEGGKTPPLPPVLTSEQFRELCAIVERRSLAEASGTRRASDLDDDVAYGGQHDDFCDADADWTLL